MSLLEELKSIEDPPKPPGKSSVSAYITERQRERLEALATMAGDWSHSKTIGRLIDLFYEKQKG